MTVGLDTMWVLIAAFLVFLMQAGFAMLETGLTRAKNACNIMMKNFMDFALAAILFFAVGYAFMFGEGNAFIGLEGFLLGDFLNGSVDSLPLTAHWLFQAVFAGTAATIVSGAVAERMKFGAYLLYTVALSALIYPLIGHWTWGGGWLSSMGFADFAGSTVVHATGGFAGLAGAMILGPRIGKFSANGATQAKMIPGHNMPMAALGTFLLWFGWYGFNAGSALAVGDGRLIALVCANTTLSAAAGAFAAMAVAWIRYGKPDLSFTMNGALAGLVGITASCDGVSPTASIFIGLVAGVLVVAGVKLLDKLKIDDPVGAISVHGINGIWGTVAVGIFGPNAGIKQFSIQLFGSLTVCLFVFVTMYAVFSAIKATLGLRVGESEELRGLDIGEHGMESYSGFQIFTIE